MSFCSDWAEHKLICGYKNHGLTLEGVKGGITLPFSMRKKAEEAGGGAK